MKIKVLVFGQLTDILKTHELELPDVKNTRELNELLAKQFPNLAGANYTMAINNKIVPGLSSLIDGDVVALLPPFSGG